MVVSFAEAALPFWRGGIILAVRYSLALVFLALLTSNTCAADYYRGEFTLPITAYVRNVAGSTDLAEVPGSMNYVVYLYEQGSRGEGALTISANRGAISVSGELFSESNSSPLIISVGGSIDVSAFDDHRQTRVWGAAYRFFLRDDEVRLGTAAGRLARSPSDRSPGMNVERVDLPNTVPPISTSRLPGGDINRNGKVDFADFLVVSHNFARSSDSFSYSDGDVTFDNKVGFADFLVVSENFGRSTVPQAAAVPEPADGLLLGIVSACLALACGRSPGKRFSR